MPFSNRIDDCFKKTRNEKRLALIGFITAGDPNLQTSEKIALALADQALDILELGMAYSDPMADGPVIQKSSQRALKAGVYLGQVLQLVKKIRSKSEVPILLMGYYNPIFVYGLKQFARDLKEAGGDGCLIVDLPPEEAGPFHEILKDHEIHQIFLLTPTSDPKRMQEVGQKASGFIYFVSLEGVTGACLEKDSGIEKKVREIRKHSSLPLAVGFGIKGPNEITPLKSLADGVVLGSALIEHLESDQFQLPFKKTQVWMETLKKAVR